MNNGFIKKLIKNVNTNVIIDSIDNLNESYKIDKFLQCLFKCLFTEMTDLDENNEESFNKISIDLDQNEDESELQSKGQNVYSNLLNDLVSKLNLNRTPKVFEFLITHAFEILVNQVNLNTDDNNNLVKNKKKSHLPNLLVEYHFCQVISKLETKYAKTADNCLNEMLKNLTNKQKNYLLTTISCKFSSFKCTTSFKYQQITGLKQSSDLNLLLGLNNTNANVRACSLDFVRNELEIGQSNKKVSLDQEFIKEQLMLRLKSEHSPQVIESLLKFDLKLTDYVSLNDLISEESTLIRLFSVTNLDESNDWLNCQQMTLNLIFTSLFKKYFNENSQAFLNSFVQILTKLFEMKSATLLKHFKKTSMFTDLFLDKINNSIDVVENNPKSVNKFNTSSISVTKVASGITQTSRLLSESEKVEDSISDEDELLNDLFETYVSLLVKYIISHKDEKSLIQFECFEKLMSQEERSISLLDFIVFEIAVRLCTQSLFLTNAFFYLKLATKIVTNWFSKKSGLKLKKFKSLQVTNETNLKSLDQYRKSLTFNNYNRIVQKKSIRDSELVECLYHVLFKSINIQMRNFVNSNSKLEIETVLNYLYVHLCVVSNDNQFFDIILKKFSEIPFFNCLTNSEINSK